ncbi:LOW QUALITY PROTEIN: germin-like protein subfamily 1 member 20 [Jatropha curcas]|uniref:LOW QUALITY PROTEIN: germin-like protein subfamily 1 member 20 n=1 Tax=Jatropha curcas TaxID=180498 RepID=UPI001894910D|nr:LOW QUALITY PROTEIN: germin-like protein subfamily 1 member 20 [Jatropha curcas]
MKGTIFLFSFTVLALAFSFASAYDPSPLQDFCVAVEEPKNAIFVNGKFCKNPKLVEANDFSFSGLNIPRNTKNGVGSNVTLVNVDLLKGLNTLGISLARLDFAPYGGLNPPHIHPRATEILVVLKGTLYVGFVTSNPSRLFAKVLYPGDVFTPEMFLFSIGLIHFQLNVAKLKAVAVAGLKQDHPGVITIANATFGSDPPINPDVLAKAFQLDEDVVAYLQKLFGGSN